MNVFDDLPTYSIGDGGSVIRLYRLIRAETPTMNDFLSAVAQGRRIRNPVLTRIADGVPMYATPAQAREAAARAAERGVTLGPYLAALAVPTDGAFRIERTTRSAGHFTVWGDANALVALAANVGR